MSRCKYFLAVWNSASNLTCNAFYLWSKLERVCNQVSGGRLWSNSKSSWVAMGQVLILKSQDLLTQHRSLGCKNDSPVSCSLATALSREGNNLGAVSLHCVLLFPLVRGGSITPPERDNNLMLPQCVFVCTLEDYQVLCLRRNKHSIYGES